jgi:hypothetical protein
MSSTIELLHYKFVSKFTHLKNASQGAAEFDAVLRLETKYKLCVVPVLSKYYGSVGCTTGDVSEFTDEYYRIVTSENFLSQMDDIANVIRRNYACGVPHAGADVGADAEIGVRADAAARSRNAVAVTSADAIADTRSRDAGEAVGAVADTRSRNADARADRDRIARCLCAYDRINIVLTLRNVDYRRCECGRIMTLVPETSDLRCECGRINAIVGTIDSEPNENTRSGKSTGYDFTRHYKFWSERVQAIEHKTFEQYEIDALRACMLRDNKSPSELNCAVVRDYLRECDMTEYNDHAALLVVVLGGPAPPRFSFQESRDLSITFNKIINLYHKVNPNGSNRPYYPYFIYKMVERKFRKNPEKLRILDYIHLQSEDTLKKNDTFYEQICALSAPEDDLVYTPTNPYERI